MLRPLFFAMLFLASSSVFGQDRLQRIRLNVMIVSGASEKLDANADPKDLIKSIGLLDQAGALDSFSKLSFELLENQVMQLSFRQNLPTGGARAGQKPKSDAAGPGTLRLAETKLTATARQSDDGVLTLLSVEQFRSESGQEGERPNAPPGGRPVVTLQATVRIPRGEPIVLSGIEDKDSDQTRHTLILVSAGISDDRNLTLKIYSLQHANAATLKEALMPILPTMTLSADDRTNSLIARGTPEQLKSLEAVIVTLDGPMSDNSKK